MATGRVPTNLGEHGKNLRQQSQILPDILFSEYRLQRPLISRTQLPNVRLPVTARKPLSCLLGYLLVDDVYVWYELRCRLTVSPDSLIPSHLSQSIDDRQNLIWRFLPVLLHLFKIPGHLQDGLHQDLLRSLCIGDSIVHQGLGGSFHLLCKLDGNFQTQYLQCSVDLMQSGQTRSHV